MASSSATTVHRRRITIRRRRAHRLEPPRFAEEGRENPLLLSGLAFAGANRRGAARLDEDDGILTAEEVAALNLNGVEWAVLSACDTGLGEIRAGEGVFGLRRAFQVAGARTVIMSLWSVDDQATRAWMRALYEARFRRGLSTADAVHSASVSRAERAAREEAEHAALLLGSVCCRGRLEVTESFELLSAHCSVRVRGSRT